ncbi:hypothetical protein PUN28_017451 [Cardiocondyla obscurior]|uniref:Uncharacterized protein n=1 Tax=Cardiocondyla obscurior TaxID=286306 RepID=A0AAW2EM22_9HYME
MLTIHIFDHIINIYVYILSLILIFENLRDIIPTVLNRASRSFAMATMTFASICGVQGQFQGVSKSKCGWCEWCDDMTGDQQRRWRWSVLCQIFKIDLNSVGALNRCQLNAKLNAEGEREARLGGSGCWSALYSGRRNGRCL